MGRTTRDLIEELQAEAPKFKVVIIAVGFEKRSECVFNSDEHPLQKLNGLVEAGGEPIGLIGFRDDGEHGTVYCRTFAEYAVEQWANDYLSDLCHTFCEFLVKSGKARILPNPANGWLN
ncbi:MAG: hypothetical protein HYX72_03400 [Acidobacteria bacterium]|nr:hypothetical protein [Acidobacteriota bacterium]